MCSYGISKQDDAVLEGLKELKSEDKRR